MDEGLRFAIREGGRTVGAGRVHQDHQVTPSRRKRASRSRRVRRILSPQRERMRRLECISGQDAPTSSYAERTCADSASGCSSKHDARGLEEMLDAQALRVVVGAGLERDQVGGDLEGAAALVERLLIGAAERLGLDPGADQGRPRRRPRPGGGCCGRSPRWAGRWAARPRWLRRRRSPGTASSKNQLMAAGDRSSRRSISALLRLRASTAKMPSATPPSIC